MPWAATWTRAIITWPRVKWHRETEEQVRNAPISLPAGFQLPTLIECLLWNLLAEETNDLCLDFYPRLICLGNKSSLNIVFFNIRCVPMSSWYGWFLVTLLYFCICRAYLEMGHERLSQKELTWARCWRLNIRCWRRG